MSFVMRKACAACGSTNGEIRNRNGQDTVWCMCGKYAGYNAPRHETGKAERSASRDGLKPGIRTRVLERDGSRCLTCGLGAPEHVIHVSHILSRDLCKTFGVPEDEIDAVENLFVECESCNLGRGSDPLPAKLALRLWILQRAERLK